MVSVSLHVLSSKVDIGAVIRLELAVSADLDLTSGPRSARSESLGS